MGKFTLKKGGKKRISKKIPKKHCVKTRRYKKKRRRIRIKRGGAGDTPPCPTRRTSARSLRRDLPSRVTGPRADFLPRLRTSELSGNVSRKRKRRTREEDWDPDLRAYSDLGPVVPVDRRGSYAAQLRVNTPLPTIGSPGMNQASLAELQHTVAQAPKALELVHDDDIFEDFLREISEIKTAHHKVDTAYNNINKYLSGYGKDNLEWGEKIPRMNINDLEHALNRTGILKLRLDRALKYMARTRGKSVARLSIERQQKTDNGKILREDILDNIRELDDLLKNEWLKRGQFLNWAGPFRRQVVDPTSHRRQLRDPSEVQLHNRLFGDEAAVRRRRRIDGEFQEYDLNFTDS